MVSWVVAVMSLVWADATGEAAAEIARARARVRERGSPLEFAMVSSTASFLAWRTGDVTATEAETEAGLAAVADEDPSVQVLSVRATAAHMGIFAALERGDRAAALSVLAAFDAQPTDGLRVIPMMLLGEARAILALACDEPDQARREATVLCHESRAANVANVGISWRISAALAALRLDEPDQARALAAEQLTLARRWGAATDFGAALRLAARVDPGRRLDLLTEAVSVLEPSPARLELARALVDLGEALRVARRRQDAHDPLRRGAELAMTCGSWVLRQRALDALAALGDRPRKLMFTGQESLTGSERRVARLAVDGRSNRDIAQELFVSPKTVENHLGRVYVKLGVAGRRHLAGALA